MDVDGDEEYEYDPYDDGEDEIYMPETRIVLVGEDNLECEFSARIASFHKI